MAATVKAIFLLLVFCIAAGVNSNPLTKGRRKTGHNPVGPPQKQTMFDFPVEQGTGPSFVDPVSVGPSFTISSVILTMPDSSSSEEVSEMDFDMDTDTNEVDAAPSVLFGRNRNQISGDMRGLLPGNGRQQAFADVEAGQYDELMSRTTGSSGRGVGIAFGVIGLIALVVAVAFFTIRRYRHEIPVLVRT
ncbi:uncharacterized protein LOC129261914 [Lytechinus pictus]|uniref:uncharacterized protein LOC129261914 n=1 Tax=Lytechinus pictus TaxID=7653 RepID=UPI0030B9FE48